MNIPEKYQNLDNLLPLNGKPRNEREELLNQFLEKLNPSRLTMGLKAMTHGRLAKIFEKVPTPDLYPFFNDCMKAKTFSSLFWWRIKGKK